MASTKYVSDCSARGIRHQVPYPLAWVALRRGLPTGLGDWCL